MTVARARTRRAEPVASPTRCWCANGRPTLYATWRNEQLVAVTREHLPVVCGLPAVVLDPTAFERGGPGDTVYERQGVDAGQVWLDADGGGDRG